IVPATPLLFLLALGGSRGPVLALIAAVGAMSMAGRRPWKTLVLGGLLLAAGPVGGPRLPDRVNGRYLRPEGGSMTGPRGGPGGRVDRRAHGCRRGRGEPVAGVPGIRIGDLRE